MNVRNLLVQIAVRVYFKKNDRLRIQKLVERPPVAGNVDAPLSGTVAAQSMIIKKRVKRCLFKNPESLFTLGPNDSRDSRIPPHKLPMELYPHCELR